MSTLGDSLKYKINNKELCDSVYKIAEHAVSSDLVSALAIQAERNGTLIFKEAWGQSRIIPETEALFDIASITKIFTSTAILRLATIKKVSLNDALCDIKSLSNISRGKPRLIDAFKKITIRHALNHSSGMRYWHPFYASASTEFGDILEDVLGSFPLSNETVYSDLNFMILGKVIESVYDAPLDIAMRDLVCNPLGLSETSYAPVPEDRCVGTEFGNRIEKKMVADLGLSFDRWRDESRAIRGQPDDGNCHYYFGDCAGHAGIFSTAKDLCTLGRMYLDNPDGKHESDPMAGYVHSELLREARTDHGNGRGLGFQMGELYPSGGFGHTGFTGTYIYINTERGITLAVLANRLHREEAPNINEIRKNIANSIVALG